MKHTDIEASLHEVERAQKVLAKVIAKRFPIGCRVGFTIMHGQVKLSWGVVRAINKDGYLHIETEMKRDRYRDVYYEQVQQTVT